MIVSSEIKLVLAEITAQFAAEDDFFRVMNEAWQMNGSFIEAKSYPLSGCPLWNTHTCALTQARVKPEEGECFL